MLLAHLRNFLLGMCWVTWSFGVPVGVQDDYSVQEDGSLVVNAADGVLQNDLAGAGGALRAVEVDNPSSGILSFLPDGSFVYRPAPNYNGSDQFTYRAIELAPDQVFTIDQNNSSVNIQATLATSFGSDSDTDTSTISGTLTVAVDPETAPFSTLHISEINAVLADAINLNFSFAFGLAGVSISGQPGALGITMLQAGPVSAVDGAGNFNQTNNQLRVSGTVNVNATGLADGQVPEGDQLIDVTNIVTDFAGTIIQNGNELQLDTPVNFTGSFDVSGNTVTLNVSGNIRATSPVKQVETSDLTSVNLVVTPVPDAPLTQIDDYVMGSNTNLVIPAVLPAGVDTLIPAGAEWRYLDDGSDQGTAWLDPAFDDSSWTNGPAQLGFGDGDELQVIQAGDTNGNHVTYYFRHEFAVADASVHGRLELRLLRDDGAAVYLNGVEVVRHNLGINAGYDDLAETVAGGAAEQTFFTFSIPVGLLQDGDNLLAVEVHQAATSSSDVSFDLELTRIRTAGGVLVNDLEVDGETLSAAVHRTSEDGSVSINSDGSFMYTPRSGFVGTDTFAYSVFDTNELQETELLAWGDTWRYLDDASDQGAAWRDPDFDDTRWAVGPAELGYGDPDHATVVNFIDTTPADPTNVTRNATTYFRNDFYLGDTSTLNTNLTLRLLRDDAAAVYINGAEIYRDANLPADAAFDTYATSGVVDENEILAIALSETDVQPGRNVVAVEVHQSSPTSSDLAFNLAITASLRPPSALISRGSDWKYLDDGSNQSNAWIAAEFDDSLWLEGPAKLGYGEGDEATALPLPSPRHITTYFRRMFHVPDASVVQHLQLELLRDDGAAVYINGTEVVRDNLPDNATYTNAATVVAADADETTYFSFTRIDPAILQTGENVIAVEVHQVNTTSSDLAMDLALLAYSTPPLGLARIEVFDAGGFLDVDADAMDDHWENANGLVVGVNDAQLDGDGDRASNLHEYYARTLPNDITSVLYIERIEEAPNGDREFIFPSVAGNTYRLQFAPNLQTSFMDVPGQILVAGNANSSFTVPADPGQQKGYWRVAVVGQVP